MSYVQNQRRDRIEELCQHMAEFDSWENYAKYAFEHLFRLGLTSEKIESDYLAGLKEIYISQRDVEGTDRHKK